MSEPFSVGRLARFTQEASVQNVSIALDDVAQGIAANPTGISGIQSMIDAFAPISESLTGQLGGPDTIQSFGGVESPGDYLGQIRGNSIYKDNALVPFKELVANLRDPEFDVAKGVLASTRNLFGGEGIGQSLVGKNGLLGASLAGIKFGYVEPAAQQAETPIESPPSALGSMPIFDKLTTTADGSVMPGMGDKAIIIVNSRPDPAIGEQNTIQLMRQPEQTISEASTGLGDKAVIVVGGKEESVGDAGFIIDGGIPDAGVGDKAVIIVGGKEESVADGGFIIDGSTPQEAVGDKAVIVVGGKQLDENVAPSFDSSLRSLIDVNPFTEGGQQALTDFATQLFALVNMESTVRSSAELFRQLSDSSSQKILE